MPAVIYDLFPAAVTVTSKDADSGEFIENSAFLIDSSRVVVTDQEILVVIDSPTGPLLALQIPYSPGSFVKGGNHYEYSHVETAGQSITFRKDDSCGCGTRLRSWNPYQFIVARG